MKYASVLLAVGCLVTAAYPQWLETTIRVGQIPYALCYNTQGDKVYVGCEGSNKVTVIDGATNNVIARPAAGNAVGLCYNQTNNRVFCADLGPDVVSVIDGATDSVIANVHVGSISLNLCHNYLDNKVYCARFDGYGVTVINGATNAVLAQVATPYQPFGKLCFNPRDDKVYCTSSDSIGYLTVIDGETDSSSRLVLGRGVSPSGLCYDAVQNRVFCSDNAHGSVIMIDCATDTVVGTVMVGNSPSVLCYDSSMNRVYCTNGGNDNVSVIDAGSNLVIATVPVGHQPRALLYDSIHNKVYCANSGSNDVTVIDGLTDSVIRTIAVGQFPNALLQNPPRNRVYVTNRDDSSVSVLRDSMTGVEETSKLIAAGAKPMPTIVRGVLVLDVVGSRQNAAYRADLLDVSGRKVAELRAGANDVKRLSPGVYFVREAQAQAVRKVVITR
jgi:YVTN family beta-propeller protein